MKVPGINRVCIIGSGTMGQQIGFLCAMHGYDVVLYDISREALGKAINRSRDFGQWYVQKGDINQAQLEETMKRIVITTDDSEAAREADLINESLPENPELKAKVFARFNDLCPERTLFTTNTSTLLPSMIAEKTGRPGRFLALHFHDIRITDVVDIMPHRGTAPEAVDLVKEFTKSIGQIAITLKKENHGYVFNAMISNLFFSALTLASRDVASIEDIDRAWMGVMHTPSGPFGMMDHVGLTTVWAITEYWAQVKGDTQSRRNADFLKKYVDEGRHGMKTKKGFYTYPDPDFQQKEFLKGSS